MKLIKPAQHLNVNDPIYHLECRWCKALWEVKKSELRFTPDQRDGDFYVLVCKTTNCLRENNFDATVLPKFEQEIGVGGQYP